MGRGLCRVRGRPHGDEHELPQRAAVTRHRRLPGVRRGPGGPRRRERSAFRHLDAQREQVLSEQGVRLARHPVADQP